MVAAIFPVFVAALAIAAFLNGFWMVSIDIFLRVLRLICLLSRSVSGATSSERLTYRGSGTTGLTSLTTRYVPCYTMESPPPNPVTFQTYAFDLLVRNDFRGITLACTTLDDGSCFCDYPSSLISSGQCALAGDDVLKALGIDGISFKLYAVILLLITLLYRFLFYLVLVFKKR